MNFDILFNCYIIVVEKLYMKNIKMIIFGYSSLMDDSDNEEENYITEYKFYFTI